MFNIVIPCAGSGQRFVDAGYKLPKPLIDVNGKPLIERVVNSLSIPGQYIFLVLEKHEKEFGLGTFIKTKWPDSVIIDVKEKTEGAACTVLLARDFIYNDNPLVIANSDQIINFNRQLFMGNTLYHDGCNLVFWNNEPCWSYVKTVEGGKITKVAEKEVISYQANCGLYSYRHGREFVDYANRMIYKNIRVKDEFYIAPIYNEMIEDGLFIKAQPCEEMLGAGTPDQLQTTEKIIKFRESGIQFLPTFYWSDEEIKNHKGLKKE